MEEVESDCKTATITVLSGREARQRARDKRETFWEQKGSPKSAAGPAKMHVGDGSSYRRPFEPNSYWHPSNRKLDRESV